jgi:hypothetical protein
MHHSIKRLNKYGRAPLGKGHALSSLVSNHKPNLVLV